MMRYQLISSLLLLLVASLVANTGAEVSRRVRYNRQRVAFARQEALPTPYPSADELKPEEPALIYGPPPSTNVDELPAEEDPETNKFQPETEESEIEALDADANSVETTTSSARLRLHSNRQRLSRLQRFSAKPQRTARLEEVAAAVPATPVTVAQPAVLPQLYYVGAQQPYVVAYNGLPQQLTW
ncbi:CG14573 [Drosophila busckii]|uniref:CG14573 n=1 Tax=Drosophila busckii TaxID=30019 RepID=A0A0M4ERT8_DROBS|nr:CG14573 [Drosophila busckii]